MSLKVPLTVGAAVLLAVLGGLWWQRRTAGVQAERMASPAGSASASSGRPGSGPIPVDTFEVVSAPFSVPIQATGTLLARESVELVSELSRRLVRVRAAEGEVVKKGAVLFELDGADLRAELGKLEVQARLAKATLDRTQKLVAEGIGTKQELESAQAAVDSAEAQRRALAVTVSKTVIRAPFAGKLGLRRVSEGAWLSPSTVLSTLHDISALKLDFTLPERYSGLVKIGSEFLFSTAGRGERYKGKVVAQEPTVDRATRSMLVRGLIESRPELLPGTFVSVEVPVVTEAAILVPTMTVIPGVEGLRVFVLDRSAEGDVARSVSIEAGTRTADRVQVLSGLKPGDQVISSNLLRVRDGAKVQVQAPQVLGQGRL